MMKKNRIFIIVCTFVLCTVMLLSACGQPSTDGMTDAVNDYEAEGTGQDGEAAPSGSDEMTEGAEDALSAFAELYGDPDATYVIDYDAMFKSRDPEEVVMTVDGKEITWNEYFYWIRYYAEYIQYYIDMYKYYGMDYKWTDPADEDGTMTLAESVVVDAKNHMGMICTIENYAEEVGYTLPETVEQQIEADLQADIVAYCGEGATEEDFDALLRETDYLSLDIYKRYSRINYLYQNMMTWLYGANGEKVSDEDALKFLEDNGYMRANHILFATIDLTTGEALDDDAVAEKLALAEKTVKELRKIKKTDNLLKKFAELKTKYCEDTGNPEGYVFTSGVMVQEFEDGWKALTDYEISDPILTQYGYHVMIRLPIDLDTVLEYSDEGTALTAKMKFANEDYSDKLQERMDDAKIVLSDSIIGFSVADFLVEAPETSEDVSGGQGE